MTSPATVRTAQIFPASFAQQRLWFFTQLVPDLAVYNIAFRTPLSAEPVDLDRFRWALTAITRRHETLRTSLAIQDGHLVQRVHRELDPDLQVLDLGQLDPAAADQRTDELIATESAVPFDLERAPLWRARLITLGDRGSVYVFVVHHAVFDARSAANLVNEMRELYRQGEQARLPELPIQYADFAAWQRDQLAGGSLDEQLAYWRRRLAGLPPEIGLPTDRPRPTTASHRGADVRFELPAETNRAVQALARAAGGPPYAVLLAAFVALLHRLSGQTDVVVGSPVAGRPLPELQPLLGMFVNSLVLRLDCGGNPSFRELVGRAADTVLEALEHSEVPFDRLVEELAPQRDQARSPLYQVVLNLMPATGDAQEGNGTAKVDLILDLFDTADGRLGGRLEYATDLFDEATAQAMADRYASLLSAAVAAPDTPTGRLPLLLAGERERLTGGRLRPDRKRPEPVLRRFDAQVRHHPDAIAVCDPAGTELSYRELAAGAHRLAHRLAASGAGPERPVALLLDSGADLVVAVLAALGAGAPYLPLDPDQPAQRVEHLLADAGAAVVATTTERLNQVPDGVPALCTDQSPSGPAGWPVTEVHPQSLAYVSYTSGSTGRPKGVGVTHGNLAAYLDGTTALLDPAPGAVWSMLQPLTFDFAVTVFWGALTSGGTLWPVGTDQATDAAWVAEHLRREAVDYLKITPSHLAALRAGAADPDALLPANTLILGGEASGWDWFRGLGGCRVVNHYGPTETTVGVLALPAGERPEPIGTLTPIGWPLAPAEAYLLDQYGELVPDGVTGELYVGGDTVSRGYLGQPGLTALRFVPDPFSGRPGARLYRTGDLARRLPGRGQGAVEFLGRSDDQVKIRGYRVELGEVRHVLAEHPEVADAAVLAHPGGPATGADASRQAGADLWLAGYLVPVPGCRPDLDAVHGYAAARLPEYLLPAALVVLDELPLTPHGKLDRAALPELSTHAGTSIGPDRPSTSTTDTGAGETGVANVEPPVGEFEEIVAGLFGRLLNRAEIGRRDSFFALGGHSLLGIQLMTRLRAAFGTALPLRAMFEDPTVAGLAARITDRLRGAAEAGGAELPAIVPVSRATPLPASYGQQRLWFLDQLDPEVPLYNTHFSLRLTGPLDAAVLHRALVEIVRRHEVLRTRFEASADGLAQVVLDRPELPLDTVELPADATEQHRWDLLTEHAGRRFDLAAGPPLRALLVRYGPDRHELLLSLHHTVFDGSSVAVLVGELAELYPALRDGHEPRLPDLPVQYGDFAAWQRAVITGDTAGGQLAYWQRRLAGLPPRLELPTDRPRPPRVGADGEHLRFTIAENVAAQLRALGAEEGATLFMTLLAGYVLLLRRYTGQHDVAVGVPLITRQRPELERLIGFFVNTLVLRVEATGPGSGPGGRQTFRDLVRLARTSTVEAYAHSDVPFEALVEQFAPERDQGSTPLVQTMFMLADDQRAMTLDLGGLTADFEPFALSHAKFDVSVFLWRRADGLSGALEYRPDLFDGATMRRFADHFTQLLAAAAADPDGPLPRLAVPQPVAHQPLALDDQTTVVELIAQQVRCTPDAVAVRHGDAVLSYRALWERAGVIAGQLRRARVVGVCLPRSSDLVAALLGVLRAGAAYLPLDPDYPPARLAYTVGDAAATVVLTSAPTAALWPDGYPTLRVDLLDPADPAHSEPDGPTGPSPEHPAYLLYTSGSTGQPKGAVIGHRALANQLRWVAAEFGLGTADRVAQRTPAGFDASVWELFAPLVSGASVVVTPAEASADPKALVDLVTRHSVTVLQLVPGLLAAHLEAGVFARCPSLRLIGCGGEPLPQPLADRLAEQCDARLVNLYGPTECCVQAVFATAVPGAPRATVPIGRPVPGVTAQVLDDEGEPVPDGVPGELYLGGVQVGHGYHGRAALTAQRFLPDPFAARPGARCYRTGDRVRRLPDGQLEYLSRLDEQVKVRGVRVELGEVRAALAELPQVRQAAVVQRELPTGPALVGYVVGPPAGAGGELRESLRGRLPAAALPASVVVLEELPLLPNGKLDRSALPEPEHSGAAGGYVAPGTPIEATLCELYARLLGRERVGVHDDFFAIGGHSLLVTQLVSWISHELGVDLALRDCFDAPTVAELAVVVLAEQLADEDLDQLLDELDRDRPAGTDPVAAIGNTSEESR